MYGVVINNYTNNKDALTLCDQLFEKYCCIDGRNLEYGYGFYIKFLFKSNHWLNALMSKHYKSIASVVLDNNFSHIISFASPIHAHWITNSIIQKFSLNDALYSQFWSDPICGNMMNYKKIIPLQRIPIYIAEKKCIQQCDDNVYGTFPLYSYQKRMYARFEKKMRYIDVACTEQREIVPLKKRADNCIRIGYFGAYPPKIRNLSPLVKSIKGIDEDIKLLICGDGDLSDIDTIPNSKIFFIKKRIPYAEAHAYELNSDILISVGNLRGCQVPGKTLYYSGLNKPIIFIADGKYAEEHKNYVTIQTP